MKWVCYLDMDGVLVDFVGGALRHFKKDIPRKDVRWDIEEHCGFQSGSRALFWEELGRHFWANLDWTEEGKELLAGLEEIFGDRILLMTSPCLTPGCAEGKLEWVRRNAPKHDRRVMIGPAKYLCAGPGKILIDDHDANVDKFFDEGGLCIQPPRPWNRLRSLTDDRGGFKVAVVLATARRLTGV